MNTSKTNLSKDLSKINDWAIQWKMSFNPYPTKQAQELIFSRKNQNPNPDSKYFNHILVQQSPTQKPLEMNLDTKFNFAGTSL